MRQDACGGARTCPADMGWGGGFPPIATDRLWSYRLHERLDRRCRAGWMTGQESSKVLGTFSQLGRPTQCMTSLIIRHPECKGRKKCKRQVMNKTATGHDRPLSACGQGIESSQAAGVRGACQMLDGRTRNPLGNCFGRAREGVSGEFRMRILFAGRPWKDGWVSFSSTASQSVHRALLLPSVRRIY